MHSTWKKYYWKPFLHAAGWCSNSFSLFENALPSVFVRLCCPRPGPQEQSGWFTHVFVDEAAQGMEPEALIPLTLARPDATGIAQVLGGKMFFLQFTCNKPADVVFCLLTEFVERAWIWFDCSVLAPVQLWFSRRRLRRVLLRKALSWKSVVKDQQRLPNLNCGRL